MPNKTLPRFKEADEEKLIIVKRLFEVIKDSSDSIVDRIDDKISVDNFDEIKLHLKTELRTAVSPLIDVIKSLSNHIQANKPLPQKDSLEVTNLKDFPTDISINNLNELRQDIVNLSSVIEDTFNIDIPTPEVNIEAPIVNVPPPIVNIPETKIDIPDLDLRPLIKEISLGLNKIRTNDKGRPLAVRLTDGSNWVNQLTKAVDGLQQQLVGFPGAVKLDSTSGIKLKSPGGLSTGTKTVTVAGTAEQITTGSTQMQYVVFTARLGNSDQIVVGDSNVVATSGSERGIILVPGNSPFRVDHKELSEWYVDAVTSGDGVCFAYFS